MAYRMAPNDQETAFAHTRQGSQVCDDGIHRAITNQPPGKLESAHSNKMQLRIKFKHTNFVPGSDSPSVDMLDPVGLWCGNSDEG
jgi:hypothetical protein